MRPHHNKDGKDLGGLLNSPHSDIISTLFLATVLNLSTSLLLSGCSCLHSLFFRGCSAGKAI